MAGIISSIVTQNAQKGAQIQANDFVLLIGMNNPFIIPFSLQSSVLLFRSRNE